MSKNTIISYILSFVVAIFVLKYNLLSSVMSGLVVHLVTCKLADRLPLKRDGFAQEAAVAVLAIFVISSFCGLGFLLYSFLKNFNSIESILIPTVESICKIKSSLPNWVPDIIPDNSEELQAFFIKEFKEHSAGISSVGAGGLIAVVHVLIGMVIGGMTSLASVRFSDNKPDFLAKLHERTVLLTNSFDKVVLAQFKISGLNTFLTTIYLCIILPLCGINLKLVFLLIIITFIAGLIPVLGNLVSNSVIVLTSLSFSITAAIASLAFLVIIHKLEYFLNAKIIGSEVNAKAWELLCAMVLMEAIFGIQGIIAAPILYAWIKAELLFNEII